MEINYYSRRNKPPLQRKEILSSAHIHSILTPTNLGKETKKYSQNQPVRSISTKNRPSPNSHYIFLREEPKYSVKYPTDLRPKYLNTQIKSPIHNSLSSKIDQARTSISSNFHKLEEILLKLNKLTLLLNPSHLESNFPNN